MSDRHPRTRPGHRSRGLVRHHSRNRRASYASLAVFRVCNNIMRAQLLSEQSLDLCSVYGFRTPQTSRCVHLWTVYDAMGFLDRIFVLFVTCSCMLSTALCAHAHTQEKKPPRHRRNAPSVEDRARAQAMSGACVCVYVCWNLFAVCVYICQNLFSVCVYVC